MAFLLADRVGETSTTIGTGTLTLLGASPGCNTFLIGIGSGNTCYYSIVNPRTSEWEEGIGTVVSGTLERTTVTNSSNADILVNFKAGTKNVVVSLPAGKLVYKNAAGNVSLPNQTTLSSTDSMLPSSLPSLNLDFVNSGQLDPRVTFARNSTAAYYDGKSVAVAEQNLLLQSEDLLTSWSTINTTVTGGQTDPLGSTTAFKLVAISGGNEGAYNNGGVFVSGTTYSISGWFKADSAVSLNIGSTAGSAGVAFSLTTVWTYFSASVAATAAGGLWIKPTSSVPIYVWHPQMEQRSSATAYTPTTTAPITNYIPVLKYAAAGVPRFDYDPITSKPLGLLIEEGRTNLFTYSSDLTNAVWGKFNVTITSNANVAPDGAQTGNQLIENTANNEHRLRVVTITKTSNQVLTYSVYVKPNGRYTQLTMENSGVGLYTTFDVLNNQYIDNVASAGWTRGQSAITSVGNGWYRCIISGTTDTALSVNVRIALSSTYSTTANQVYTGNGYSGIFIWGAQLEAGSFATSYIPTVASTVTRAADNASITGTNFSSWYNQSQGSFYAESNPSQSISAWYILSNQKSASGRIMYSNGSGIYSYDGTNVGTFTSSTVANGIYKTACALTPKLNTNTADGNAPTTNITNGNLLDSTALYIGSSAGSFILNGHIRKLSYYPRALSSSELQGLTK